MTRHILANLEFSPLPICAPICTLPFLFCFCRSLELRRGKARCLMCDEYPHSVTRNAQVPPRGVTDHVTVPFIQTTLAVPPPPPRRFPAPISSPLASPPPVPMHAG